MAIPLGTQPCRNTVQEGPRYHSSLPSRVAAEGLLCPGGSHRHQLAVPEGPAPTAKREMHSAASLRQWCPFSGWRDTRCPSTALALSFPSWGAGQGCADPHCSCSSPVCTWYWFELGSPFQGNLASTTPCVFTPTASLNLLWFCHRAVSGLLSLWQSA